MQRLCGLALILLQIWVPVVVLSWPGYKYRRAWADDFSSAASRGQSFGATIMPSPESLGRQDDAGNLIINLPGGNATTIRPQDLFPDMANTSDPGIPEDSDAVIHNMTNSNAQEMQSSNSYTGQAYRVLLGSSNRARVNMSQDPIWAQIDTAIQQAVNGELTECHTEYIQIAGSATAHVPDYKTCEKIVYPGQTCHLYHDYSIEVRYELGMTVGAWTDDDANITVDLKVPRVLSCWGAHGCSGCTVSAPGYDYEAVCGGIAEGVVRIISGTSNSYYAGIGQHPTCENNLIATAYVHNAPGSHSVQWCAGSFLWKAFHIIDRGWTADPGCEVLLTNPDGDAIIRPTAFDCTLGPCGGSAAISGLWVSQSNLYSNNPLASKGISNLAKEVTVTLENFNQGVMDCWTDPQGVEHCPENLGDRHNTCEEYENNPACAFVRQECIEGARDPNSGVCYAFNVVYDCGYDVQVGDSMASTIAMVCDGAIRCMGMECIEGQFDPNSQDFGRATALLQAVQYVSSDVDCSDASAGGCVVFKGKFYDCKKALGGWVNCCEEPENVSLIHYIKLLGAVHSMATIDWSISVFGPTISNPFTGVFPTLSETGDYLSGMLTSAWDSITGNTSVATSTTAGATITQSLMNAAYNWTAEYFPTLAENLFSVTMEEIAPNVFVTTSVQFAPWLTAGINFFQYAMWLYAIYNVLDILVHIIWACEEEEFELGAKKQLKVCHYVGSYCNTQVLGICIEKRDSYCCFNSPLSRILQEQVRNQTGRGWGSNKDPDCNGLYTYELANVDWSRIDLSEWLALLSIAGEAPTQRDLNLTGLTGSGSQFAFDGAMPRSDAAERTKERLGVYQQQTGETLEDLRINTGLNKWGSR